MTRSRWWLAALAATGSAVGAGVALSSAPGVPASAAPSPTAAGDPRLQVGQLASVETEANRLRSMIVQLRRQVETERTAQAASLADSSRLQAEQAQVAAEASQLNAEQASLTTERAGLAADAANLQAEQQQLAAEAKQLAAAPAAPTTHATTGASGSTSEHDGGHDD